MFLNFDGPRDLERCGGRGYLCGRSGRLLTDLDRLRLCFCCRLIAPACCVFVGMDEMYMWGSEFIKGINTAFGV